MGGDTINKRQKEVLEYQLEEEKKVIQELEKQYAAALKDINEKVKGFQADIDLLDQALSQDGLDDATKALLQSQKRSKVYQKQYQEILKSQVSAILSKMQADNYSTIDKYLHSCYESGFIGTMYDIAGQNIPLIVPIDQAAAVKAVLTDSKISNGLYNALGVDVAKLKKTITQEISRGIASSLPYRDIARNLKNTVNVPLYNAKRIVRTESHRIQQQSTEESRKAAAKRGADVVRMWDAALDGRTRDSHRRVDGEIRELDEKFSNGLMFPGDPSGSAAEVVNCRCVALTRARWALDEEELQTLKDRAEYFGLDKTKNFEEYKQKYLKASEESESQWGIVYGNTDVDFKHINSREYKDKFSALTGIPEVNESLYDTSKAILKHCDGTEHEDMYLFDASSGSIISKVTDTARKGGISYTKEFEAALAESRNNGIPIIGLHNHPQGTPPSPDDFRKAFENGYEFGIVIGHNGQLYRYEAPKKGLSRDETAAMSRDIGMFVHGGMDIDRAFRTVYDSFEIEYTIIESGDM